MSGKINYNDDIGRMRIEWRGVRDRRLKRKEELISLGYDNSRVRRDRTFKGLRKEQDRLSKLIRHAEKKLNRARALAKKTAGAL